MYKIYLDTRDRYKLNIVLKKDDETIFSEEGKFDLTEKIVEALRKNNLKPSDIEEVLAADGQGSFTGLKLGFTIANVYNWANGKKKAEEIMMPDYGAEPFITPPKKFKL